MAPRLFRYFRGRGCHPATAEDLCQEVMLAVYRHSAQIRDHELFLPWFYRIAHNELLQHYERETRQPKAVQMADAALENVREPSSDPLLALQFAEWMRFLEPEERNLMVLRYVEGREFHEIAEESDLPQGTAQWKIFQATRKLMARFGRKAANP